MKTGLKTLTFGVILIIVGAIVVPATIILPFMFGDAEETQFIIPGSKEYEIEDTGRYYLWNDFQTVFGGKSYNRTESIPDGLEITVEDKNGKIFNFISSTSMTTSSGNSKKKSIGYIEVDNPGKLVVSVVGESEERVFSFSQFRFLKLLGKVLGGIGLSALTTLSGVGFSIWGIIKLTRKNRGEPVAGTDPTR